MLDFPNSPTVGQLFPSPPTPGVGQWQWNGVAWIPVADGGAVRFDKAQSLTSPQMAQARANIGLMKRNYVINGGMYISQQNGATAGSTSGYYPVDMFFFMSTTGSYTVAQVASVTPGGSPFRFRLTCNSGPASPAAGDYLLMSHRFEGSRIVDLKLGSAAAKTVTVQFGWKAPAGNYCLTLQNYSTAR